MTLQTVLPAFKCARSQLLSFWRADKGHQQTSQDTAVHIALHAAADGKRSLYLARLLELFRGHALRHQGLGRHGQGVRQQGARQPELEADLVRGRMRQVRARRQGRRQRKGARDGDRPQRQQACNQMRVPLQGSHKGNDVFCKVP